MIRKMYFSNWLNVLRGRRREQDKVDIFFSQFTPNKSKILKVQEDNTGSYFHFVLPYFVPSLPLDLRNKQDLTTLLSSCFTTIHLSVKSLLPSFYLTFLPIITPIVFLRLHTLQHLQVNSLTLLKALLHRVTEQFKC